MINLINQFLHLPQGAISKATLKLVIVKMVTKHYQGEFRC